MTKQVVQALAFLFVFRLSCLHSSLNSLCNVCEVWRSMAKPVFHQFFSAKPLSVGKGLGNSDVSFSVRSDGIMPLLEKSLTEYSSRPHPSRQEMSSCWKTLVWREGRLNHVVICTWAVWFDRRLYVRPHRGCWTVFLF